MSESKIYYKGRGEHSVDNLEKIIEQSKFSFENTLVEKHTELLKLKSWNDSLQKMCVEKDAEIARLQSANEELSLLYAEVVTAMPNNFRMIIEDKYKLQSALDVAVEALGATWPNVFQEIYEHHQAALDKIKLIREKK